MKAELEAKIERLLPLIPEEPPQNSAEILEKRGLLKGEILVYDIAKRGKTVRGICSVCGKESFFKYIPGASCPHGYSTYGFVSAGGHDIGNGDLTECPNCRASVKAVHRASYKSWYEINRHDFVTVHNIDGHLAVLSWIAYKIFRNDGNKKDYFFRGYEGVIVVDRKLVRLRKYCKFMCSYSWLSEWEYTKTYQDGLGIFSRNECLNIVADTVDKTDCFASALSVYMRDGHYVKKCREAGGVAPGRYLKLWLKHPNVENLVRNGFSPLVSQIIAKAVSHRNYYTVTDISIKETDSYVDWKKVKPAEMLGLKKDEVQIIKGRTLDDLAFFRFAKTRGVRLTAEQLDIAGDLGEDEIEELISKGNHGYKPPLIRLLNYLKKQKGQAFQKSLITPNYLRDYWNSLYQVYKELPSCMLWPKDLRKAHDDILLRVKEKESAEINAKITGRLAELTRLTFKDEETGLEIFPARSHNDLIKEGKLLVHCVANYAKSYSEGGTNIFLIRHIAEPEVPYFTLELSNKGTVVQNRGYKNCSRTPEVKIFEAKWLDFIRKIKEKKNGKRINAQPLDCAGT